MRHNNAKGTHCCICRVIIVRPAHQNYINTYIACLVNVIWRPWWMHEMSVGMSVDLYWHREIENLDKSLSHCQWCVHS